MRLPRLKSSYISGQLLMSLVLTSLAALVGRLVFINASQGPRLLARTFEQQRSTVPLPARRGLIVDCHGRILAGTALQKSVFADPALMPDKLQAAEQVGQILDLPTGELGQDLVAAGSRRFFVVRRRISDDQAAALRATRVPGIGVFEEPYRTYPLTSLAAQVVGFVSRDGAGLAGIEHQCESWLSGESGVKTIVCDAARRAFWLAEDGYQPPRDGYHVVLTIDAVIQAAAERELQAAVDKFKAESGVAVVMDPRDGAILAMANVPTFDPNHFQDYAEGSAWRFRNRAVTDPFEPGSTFKPFIAAWALAERVTQLGEIIDCEAGMWRDGKRLLHDHHPYSGLSFEDVVAKSSNIGMAKLGKRLGNRRLQAALRAYGFGQKTGVGIVGESEGIVPPPHQWTSFSTTSVPMGQEIAVTPVQMVRAFASLVNGGRLVEPFMVRAILASDGGVVQEHKPTSPREILNRGVANTMRDVILTGVVNHGTGTQAALGRYQVVGKTGTAQVPKPGGGYVPDAYVSSFVGAVPRQDPRLVVFVAVRRPVKSIGYYGGTVAAPAARQIMASALAYLQVPAERDSVVEMASGSAGD